MVQFLGSTSLERLEGRLPLAVNDATGIPSEFGSFLSAETAGIGSRTEDAGDFYWSGTEKVLLRRVVRRSDEWVFAPETTYERQGDVNGVVFPCGWILNQATGVIRLYYGGADTCLALATAQLTDVLAYLSKCPDP